MLAFAELQEVVLIVAGDALQWMSAGALVSIILLILLIPVLRLAKR
ncbi:MAG: hypothetical protein IT317_13600 [Anaerolineales bacterium]|nr:hypothetical protein [Anaerolineales bacterium]